ncbi:hypothetical protein JCM3774_000080 [Rhodotorula dairenensis]
MDPFEVRMQFTTLVSRQLTSSVSSISKVAAFALKHAAKCSDDIWDCYLEEVGAVSLNGRVNLLYLLDALLEKEGPKLVTRGVSGSVVGQGSYRALAERDLGKVVAHVVPETREGVLNWMSTHQLLRSWRQRRLLDVTTLDQAISELEERKHSLHAAASSSSSSSLENFSRNDILRRIEDDRERQKRLKERLWVLPVPTTIYSLPLSTSIAAAAAQSGGPPISKISPASPASPFDPSAASSVPAHMRPPTATDRPPSAGGGGGHPGGGGGAGGPRGPEVALDIEFEQLWEANEEERKLAGYGSSTTTAAAAGPDEVDDSDGQIPRPWPLSPAERAALRSERERCFATA